MWDKNPFLVEKRCIVLAQMSASGTTYKDGRVAARKQKLKTKPDETDAQKMGFAACTEKRTMCSQTDSTLLFNNSSNTPSAQQGDKHLRG